VVRSGVGRTGRVSSAGAEDSDNRANIEKYISRRMGTRSVGFGPPSVPLETVKARTVTKGLAPVGDLPFAYPNLMRNWWTQWWGLCCLWGLGWLAASAQTASFGAGLRSTPDPAVAGSEVTFRLSLTNLSLLALTDVQVTVLVQGAGQFISADNPFGSFNISPSANSLTNTLVFFVSVLTNSEVANLRYTFRPDRFGSIEQDVFGQAFNAFTSGTNFVTQVLAGRADLRVAFSSVPVGSLAGDLLAYSLTITNAGPDPVLDARLTNTLPASLTLLGVDPAGQDVRQNDRDVVLRLGALATASATAVQLRVQPGLSGALTLMATVGAPGYENPAGSNRQATATLTIANPGPGLLLATISSAQVFNSQTGLMEQRVRVRNVGTVTVPATRVVVSGLTNGLYNAAGTNGGLPFVTLPGLLPVGAEVEVMLQYFNPFRRPGGEPSLIAQDVPVPGPVHPIGTGIMVSKILPQADGTVWLEFPTTLGRRYAVLYGEDVQLLEGAALPVVTAPGSRMFWIDYGPPLTSSGLLTVTSRFYEVIEVTWP